MVYYSDHCWELVKAQILGARRDLFIVIFFEPERQRKGVGV